MTITILKKTAVVLLAFTGTFNIARSQNVDACPGYKAVNIQETDSSIEADLILAGAACNVYGLDLQKLKLEVNYETGLDKMLGLESTETNLIK